MVIMVRPATGLGRREQVPGGYNAAVIWQDLGGGDTDLTFGPDDVRRLTKLAEEHAGVTTITRMIREHGVVIVWADDIAPGGKTWRG